MIFQVFVLSALLVLTWAQNSTNSTTAPPPQPAQEKFTLLSRDVGVNGELGSDSFTVSDVLNKLTLTAAAFAHQSSGMLSYDVNYTLCLSRNVFGELYNITVQHPVAQSNKTAGGLQFYFTQQANLILAFSKMHAVYDSLMFYVIDQNTIFLVSRDTDWSSSLLNTRIDFTQAVVVTLSFPNVSDATSAPQVQLLSINTDELIASRSISMATNFTNILTEFRVYKYVLTYKISDNKPAALWNIGYGVSNLRSGAAGQYTSQEFIEVQVTGGQAFVTNYTRVGYTPADTMSPSTPVSTLPPSTGSSSGVSVPILIAIAVLGGLVVIICIGLLIRCCRDDIGHSSFGFKLFSRNSDGDEEIAKLRRDVVKDKSKYTTEQETKTVNASPQSTKKPLFGKPGDGKGKYTRV